MGPIDSGTGTSLKDATSKIATNEKALKYIQDILSMDDLAGFTASGKDIANVSQSEARLGSLHADYFGEYEGQTMKALTQKAASIANENAILKAVVALQTPVMNMPKPQVPVPTPIASAVPSVSGLMSRLNPILNAANLMTYSSDLNQDEDQELAQRRTQAPTISGQ